MRVKLTARLASPRGNWEAGEVISVSSEEGKALVAARCGVALQDPPVIATKTAELAMPVLEAPETATIEPKESAVLPRGRGRRRGSNEE